jgi:hypothetical protein
MFARFWGKLVSFFFGGILGTIFGVALGFFFFPYVFPPPPAAEQLTQADLMPAAAEMPSAQAAASLQTRETSTPAAVAAPLSTGSFIHANPSDPVHWGKGKVSIYQRAVFLEPDFEVGPGPAFHVYLVPKPSIRSSSDIKDVMYVDLGGLRSFKGSQRYPIPDGVNLKDYPSVIIWCERFGVLISPADLKIVQAAN